DRDEEEDLVLLGLAGTDGDVRPAFDARVDEGVAGERALRRDLPAEKVGEELAGGVGVLGTDLCVDYWMRHGALLGRRAPDGPACPNDEPRRQIRQPR